MPWFRATVLLPSDPPCDFPNLKIPSDSFVCKKTKAIIEGKWGKFYGIVCKSTRMPDGYGVFEAWPWVHCGQVRDKIFVEGRMVSVNKGERVLKLTN